MALRDSPPFRADHVGSLLRPKELLAARERNDPNLRELEDAAIRDAVEMQREVGLRTATDGEFRRASWHMDFIYSLDGVTKAPGDLVVKFHNAQGDIQFTPAAMRIDGRLGVSDTIFGVRVVCAATNLKCSTIGCGPAMPSLPVTWTPSLRVAVAANAMPVSMTCFSAPSRPHKKSRCHHERRNSPSVMACRPTSSCFLMTRSISRSSISFSA